MGKTFLRGLACSVSAVSMAALLAPAAAVAQQAIYQFNIPAQDLGAALRAYGQASGQQIMFEGRDVRGKQSTALVGGYSAEDGLRRLLDGTGLQYARSQAGVLLVQDPASPTRLGGDERAATNEPVQEETIVVTGTRIRSGNSGGSATYVFDREDIDSSGAGSVQQLLSTLPQNFTGGLSDNASALVSSRNISNANLGFYNSINLRGLGSESTLVLLDGRRMAPAGFGAAADVSSIPLGAIERVEIVPDGASAIYGSDAVGGVVNFVLRDDYEGAETRVRYAAVTDGGLRRFTLNQLAGTAWGSGSVMANFEFGQNEPLLGRERPYARGLQTGMTYLSPSDERIGVLIQGRQALTPNIELSLLTRASVRDAETFNYARSTGRQQSSDATTSEFTTTLALDWDINDAWRLTLARTDSKSESARTNVFFPTATLARSTTGVNSSAEVNSTELDLEGALFSAPGGDIRLAIGGEHREESVDVYRVNFTAGRNPRVNFDRDVKAAYAELFVPLIGAENATPWAQRLSFTLAGRYEDYSDVGRADTWKIGGLYEPIDGVTFRASHGTSFRAPYLYQYDQSLGAGVVFNAANPASSTGFTLTALLAQAPDPNLGPENATTWTTGFDIDPDRLFGVRLSATYFDISYEDRIIAARASLTPWTDPLLRPLLSMPADPVILAQIAALPMYTNLTTSPLSAVAATFDARIRNQASAELNGVDATISRLFETGAGDFDIGLSASYLLAFEVSQTLDAPSIDIAGLIYNPPNLRGRAHLTWSGGPWSISTFVNYTDDYTDNQVATAPASVDSWTTVDAGVSYRFSDTGTLLDGLVLRANASNIFDEDPPAIIDRGSTAFGDPGYDTENANPFGRIVALEIVKTW